MFAIFGLSTLNPVVAQPARKNITKAVFNPNFLKDVKGHSGHDHD